MVESHCINAATLSLGTQVRRITEHFGQGYKSLDMFGAAAHFHAFHAAAARVQVTDNVTHIIFRNNNFHFYIRFEKNGIRFAGTFFETYGTGNLESHFRGVDIMV